MGSKDQELDDENKRLAARVGELEGALAECADSCGVMRIALEKIAAEDYRGNRPRSVDVARVALALAASSKEGEA